MKLGGGGGGGGFIPVSRQYHSKRKQEFPQLTSRNSHSSQAGGSLYCFIRHVMMMSIFENYHKLHACITEIL